LEYWVRRRLLQKTSAVCPLAGSLLILVLHKSFIPFMLCEFAESPTALHPRHNPISLVEIFYDYHDAMAGSLFI